MRIDRLDHLVLTVADVGRTVEFYERVLGMQAVTFAGGRRALRFGNAKINLHQAGQELEPKAARPVPGTELPRCRDAKCRVRAPGGKLAAGLAYRPTQSSSAVTLTGCHRGAAAVTGTSDDCQLGAWRCSRQFAGGVEAARVHAALDQHAGNAGQVVRVGG